MNRGHRMMKDYPFGIQRSLSDIPLFKISKTESCGNTTISLRPHNRYIYMPLFLTYVSMCLKNQTQISSFNFSTTLSISSFVLCLLKEKRTVTWLGLLLMALIT